MEGQDRLFNELTHKWLNYVHHVYLNALPKTENFRKLKRLYDDMYFRKVRGDLEEFRNLLREEGY